MCELIMGFWSSALALSAVTTCFIPRVSRCTLVHSNISTLARWSSASMPEHHQQRKALSRVGYPQDMRHGRDISQWVYVYFPCHLQMQNLHRAYLLESLLGRPGHFSPMLGCPDISVASYPTQSTLSVDAGGNNEAASGERHCGHEQNLQPRVDAQYRYTVRGYCLS